MKRGIRRLLWVCGVLLVLSGLAVVLWIRKFHEYTPVEALQDLHAAARVGPAEKPVERFMQIRYGPLSNPANRQKAFLDFFNTGHIKGLNMLVERTHPSYRQKGIDAMAQWVADYRATLTPAEKAALGAYVNSEAGRATIQRATAEYMREDAHYRASTAGVVQELLATLSTVRRPSP